MPKLNFNETLLAWASAGLTVLTALGIAVAGVAYEVKNGCQIGECLDRLARLEKKVDDLCDRRRDPIGRNPAAAEPKDLVASLPAKP